MVYYLILWMFACPVSYESLGMNYQGPLIPGYTQYIEERFDYSRAPWDKTREIRECSNGLAVWAKAQKVTRVDQVSKPGKDRPNGSSSYITIEEVKTVVYIRE